MRSIMTFQDDAGRRGPQRLVIELLLALVLVWAAVTAQKLSAESCEPRLVAVEPAMTTLQPYMQDSRSCQ